MFKQKPKILFLTRTNQISGGGEATFINNLTENISFNKLFDHTFFFYAGIYKNSLAGLSLLDEYIFFRISKIFSLLKNAHNSDIVNFNGIHQFSVLVIYIFVRLVNSNLVVIFHSNMNSTIWDKYVLFRKMRKMIVVNICTLFSKKLIFITFTQLNDYKKLCVFKNKFNVKATSIYNFIKDEVVVINRSIQLNKEIIFVGRFTPNKGSEEIISLSKKMPELNFAVIGKKPHVLNFRYGANLIFKGELDSMAVINHLHNSSVFILPSYDEVFPITILEAMSQGCVVICSDLPQIREWFKDGINGFLVPVGNVEELSNKIKYLHNNQDILATISQNNIHDIKNYTETNQVPKYINVYSEIVNPKHV